MRNLIKKLYKYSYRILLGRSNLVNKNSIIKRNVKLDSNVKVGPWVIIDGEAGEISIDAGSSVNAHCWIGAGNSKISIGKDVRIGTGTKISCAAHNFNDTNIPIRKQGLKKNVDINIENDCWIGMNVSICPGVTIGKGSVIGAGSVVVKDIPAWSIAVGVPAKIIKSRKNNF